MIFDATGTIIQNRIRLEQLRKNSENGEVVCNKTRSGFLIMKG